MLSMVVGLGRLRAQPARRPHVLLRAGAAAGVDDRRGRRGRSRSRRSARRSTPSARSCSSRACCCRSAPTTPSAAAQATGCALMAAARARAAAGAARTPAVESTSTWRRADRDRARPVLGGRHRAVRDRGGDRRSTCSTRGSVRCAPTLLVERPAVGAASHAGGFLDPLIGTRAADRDGHRDRPAARRRDRAVARRVRPPALAGRARRVGHRGHRRHARSIVLAIFGLALFQQRSSASCRSPPRATPSSGARSSSPRDDVARSRCRSSSARRARRCMAVPAPRARGVLRARQDALGDDPPRPAAVDRARHRHRQRARHGPHRRRHRDRRDPARRHAAPRRRRRACRCSSTLRGTGSTLTSYVYNNSPAGEGNASDKAYAAAFVLLVVVIALNFAVDLIARGRKDADRWN